MQLPAQFFHYSSRFHTLTLTLRELVITTLTLTLRELVITLLNSLLRELVIARLDSLLRELVITVLDSYYANRFPALRLTLRDSSVLTARFIGPRQQAAPAGTQHRQPQPISYGQIGTGQVSQPVDGQRHGFSSQLMPRDETRPVSSVHRRAEKPFAPEYPRESSVQE